MNLLTCLVSMFVTILSGTWLARFILSYITAGTKKWGLVSVFMCFLLAWGITGIVLVVKY